MNGILIYTKYKYTIITFITHIGFGDVSYIKSIKNQFIKRLFRFQNCFPIKQTRDRYQKIHIIFNIKYSFPLFWFRAKEPFEKNSNSLTTFTFSLSSPDKELQQTETSLEWNVFKFHKGACPPGVFLIKWQSIVDRCPSRRHALTAWRMFRNRSSLCERRHVSREGWNE